MNKIVQGLRQAFHYCPTKHKRLNSWTLEYYNNAHKAIATLPKQSKEDAIICTISNTIEYKRELLCYWNLGADWNNFKLLILNTTTMIIYSEYYNEYQCKEAAIICTFSNKNQIEYKRELLWIQIKLSTNENYYAAGTKKRTGTIWSFWGRSD